MSYKKYALNAIALTLCFLLIIAVIMVVIDPLCQYHMPWFGLQMDYSSERYQNPGIEKNEVYTNVIMGNSMTENFDEEWFNESFGTTVKMSFEGARSREYALNLRLILNSANHVERVFLVMDGSFFSSLEVENQYDIPEYLYDYNFFNDVQYWFNFDIIKDYLYRMLKQNRRGNIGNRNTAVMWQDAYVFSRDETLAGLKKIEKQDAISDGTEYLKLAKANLENIIPYIVRMPDTEFVLWVAPYSMAWWYQEWCNGKIDVWKQIYIDAIEKMLEYSNVTVYFFADDRSIGIISDLENYKDIMHYSQQINRYIYQCFVNGDNRITAENYEAILDQFFEYIETYPYEEDFFGEDDAIMN